VSVWDPRSGLSTCTFYGHRNSCNSVAFTQAGTSLASADADGVVKLWDVRMVAEVFTVKCSEYPANKATFDASGLVSTQVGEVGLRA
jgi:WD40 repeat protein